MLSGTLGEGLGRTEMAMNFRQAPSILPDAQVAPGGRRVWTLTCEQASSSFMM